jgi:Protein of unknown function (DUF4235)
MLTGALFKRVWRSVAHEPEAPTAKDRDRTWSEVLAAAAIRGALFGGVEALIDRAGATGFARLTGVWPGKTEVENGLDGARADAKPVPVKRQLTVCG